MTGRRKMEKHGDPVDRASDIEQEERERMLEERNRSREKEENADQAKDPHGRVICIECSVILPEGRLKAMRYAAYCVGCQEQYENNVRRYR